MWARHDTKMYIGLHVKYRTFLSDFKETWIFSKDFQKKKILKYQISWKSVKWKQSCSMRTDGRKEMMKLTVASSHNCEKPPKNWHCSPSQAKGVTYLDIPRHIRGSKGKKNRVIISDRKINQYFNNATGAHNVFIHIFLPNPTYMFRCVKKYM